MQRASPGPQEHQDHQPREARRDHLFANDSGDGGRTKDALVEQEIHLRLFGQAS